MAKKKSTEREKITNFSSIKWAINNLTEKELSAADDLEFDIARFAEWLDVLIDNEGLDFKFGWDTYSKCFQMSLMGLYKGFPNSEYAVSARSDVGFEDCARLLVFKFDTIANRDLSTVYEEVRRGSKRG